MIDFLKPPTDNLYKFMTLSGLILLLFSLSYPPWLLNKTKLAIYDAQRDLEILEMEQEADKTKYDEFNRQAAEMLADRELVERQLDALEKRIKSSKSANDDAAVVAEFKRLQTLFEEKKRRHSEIENATNEMSRSFKRKSIELTYKLRVLEWESRTVVTVGILALLGTVGGFLLGVRGFNLWSLRVQVFQDAILKKQAVLETETKEESTTED